MGFGGRFISRMVRFVVLVVSVDFVNEEDANLLIWVVVCWYFPYDFLFILDLETWSMIFFFHFRFIFWLE